MLALSCWLPASMGHWSLTSRQDTYIGISCQRVSLLPPPSRAVTTLDPSSYRQVIHATNPVHWAGCADDAWCFCFRLGSYQPQVAMHCWHCALYSYPFGQG